MELHDTFGNTTLLTFKNVQQNISLRPSHFVFVKPQGVEELRDDK